MVLARFRHEIPAQLPLFAAGEQTEVPVWWCLLASCLCGNVRRRSFPGRCHAQPPDAHFSALCICIGSISIFVFVWKIICFFQLSVSGFLCAL